MSEPNAPAPTAGSSHAPVVRTITPRMRKVLHVLFALVALLVANAGYLSSITLLEWLTGQTYQDYFYQYMFLGHLILGLLFILPFLLFGISHLRLARNRRNRKAVKIGYVLFGVGIVVLVSGILLTRVSQFDLKDPLLRRVVYWAHVVAPVAALWLYGLHRLAGPRIKWKLGTGYAVFASVTIGAMVIAQSQDPRNWFAQGPESGAKYFEPSLARTATGNFIPAKTLMNDDYCQTCHEDVHRGWKDSVHHFSSFNNPPYLASVHETRKMSLARDGNVQAARWCAGCHDPVPFFSGAFDDPNFDLVNHETSHAGITCTVCHTITHVNSVKGNADYTIEEPQHYPFAFSENPVLKWVNHQLVKAKPSFHKKTFLKPFHKTAEFCSTCHKVHLPKELNHYKEFLRGQNHYDSWLLSGVSGHGARSFYYPPKAEHDCNGCHMPLQASNDFGAQYFDGAKELSIHDHLFPSANTGIAWLNDKPNVIEAHRQFLKDIVRVDLFGIREGTEIDGPLTGPLRPMVPTLKPGSSYVLESVIRTLKLGHLFTQGTTDSNEIWLQITASTDDQRIGASGLIQSDQSVDEWSHFVNNFILDRDGNRIDRRNAQDIFVPLYVHQIPPGAGQTVHYRLQIPETMNAPVHVKVRLLYRKFDSTYMDYVARKVRELGADPIRGDDGTRPYRNELPITVLAEDEITFAIDGVDQAVTNPKSEIPEWQRWNDYGIGMLLKGKAELKQAAEAFRKVEELGRYDGPLNLARVLFAEAGPGQLDEAVEAVKRAAAHTDPPAPPWTLAWLSGIVNQQQGNLTAAEENFRQVLEYRTKETVERKFDFSMDYTVLNLLGQTLYNRATQFRGDSNRSQRETLMREAAATFQRTLLLDSENFEAHYNLAQLYRELGDHAAADEHEKLHIRYKQDDTAMGEVAEAARRKYPAANAAAEPVVIYELQRSLEGREYTAEDADGGGAALQNPGTVAEDRSYPDIDSGGAQ
ncbi:MAG: hypothetical protein KDA96_09250 [Planctomycetaceae bacterium]|nr:hypothetical protein [Planctomycetaceae bacterium]